MKWYLFLIPLLFYSVFSDAAVTRSGSSPTAAECAARPVLYKVTVPNYWKDSSSTYHAYIDGCEYINKSLLSIEFPEGYFGDWYPTGSVMPEPGQGSGSHPGNGSSDVDLSSMGSPVMEFTNLKQYKKKGNTSAGQSQFLYNGVVYSVNYDAAKDVTTYNPVSYDPAQKQPFYDYTDGTVSNSVDNYLKGLNSKIRDLEKYRDIFSSYIDSHADEKSKYFNDYQSAVNLVLVYSQLISAAQTDILRIKSLGYNPSSLHFVPSVQSQYFIVGDKGSFRCVLSNSYCDFAGNIKFIVYDNKSSLTRLKEKYYTLPDSAFIYSESSTYKLFKPSFNHNSATYFLSYSGGGLHSDFFSKPSNAYLNHILNNTPLSPPFMDFTQSADDDSGSGDSGNPDSGSGNPDNPSVTPPDGGDSGGGGTVTPPGGGGGGGGGGGDSGGTDTPDTGSQCVPGAPGWPDCDDQSGQPGGGDSSGDSGSGGDKPGTGDSGGGGGGSGGGHGSGGTGQGGGNTDGDGDLLAEVKRFHADVNAALKPDGSSMPQFSDKDADFSEVQKGLDKQEQEQSDSWVSGADKLKSTLGGISGSLPSTELDMSQAVPVGITGVCRPWEFDIIIGITDGKQFKQHVVMTQFCTWYDTYIRPFVTWSFNFLTAVAVFNILYKGLRTID